MGLVTLENVHDVFSHQRPDSDGVARISQIRESAESFAKAILANSPSCADQSAALRHVREAMMNANAAIVLGGKI
jgi:hypothetical protein